MKPSSLLKLGLILAVLNGSLVSGQENVLTGVSTSPFSKGNTFLNLSNKIDFKWKNLKTDGVDAGNRNNYQINIIGTYFLVDNLGVGIGVHSERSKEGFEDFETSSSTVGSFHVIYGQAINGVINAYGRAEVRGGFDKYNYESDIYSEDTRHSNFGLNFEVGAPLSLGSKGGFYLTPYLAYDYNVLKDDTYKDNFSGLYLGSRLNLSLPCASFANECSEVRDFSEGKYSKGMNVIGGYSQLKLNIGGAKYLYNNTNGYEEYGKNSVLAGSLMGEFYHYFFDNIAIGGEVRLKTSGEEDKESGDKENSFSWMAKPTVLVNVPAKGNLNNAFGFAGLGIGTASDKTISTETTENYSETRTSLFLGAGYNLFFTESFSMVPLVNYTWAGLKDTETEIKSSRNGIETGIYFRYFF